MSDPLEGEFAILEGGPFEDLARALAAKSKVTFRLDPTKERHRIWREYQKASWQQQKEMRALSHAQQLQKIYNK